MSFISIYKCDLSKMVTTCGLNKFNVRQMNCAYSLVVFLFILLYAHFSSGQSLSKYIVVDQFGYLPDSKKVAVVRDPHTGYDAGESFLPGGVYAVVNVTTKEQVFSGNLQSWKNGAEDASSGDKVWWFDFSIVQETGTYYIVDVEKDVRSYEFKIALNVYDEVLKQAVRTFFFQRAGFEKSEQFTGTGWADDASHIGNLQDKNARAYNNKNDASTEVDVHGGWYDAGDYNKYTNWTANYIVDFMRAYLESPQVWRDDYNIPESGNGIPDLLDEAKWGLEFLLRMQQEDGSVLSIVGVSHASPPSSAQGQSLYGTASTTATLNSAAAFALASTVYASIGMPEFANTLAESAVEAWNWAEANPNVRFYNNEAAHATQGLGAGQQEPGLYSEEEYAYNRTLFKLEAACYLFGLTGESVYRSYFDDHYDEAHLLQWNYAYPFETTHQQVLLYYTTLPEASSLVVSDIKSAYENAMNGTDNFLAYYNESDPYMAYLKDYTWGSNSIKAAQGLMFMDMITYDIDDAKSEDAKRAAEGYVHYLHGVNPFNLVYLSNMYDFGGDQCVNEFYHTWFSNGSAEWDRVGVSAYGPPPGYLTGGPNPSYNWDACCPDNCGGNNAVCTSESLSPPKGQPAQKSYKDFNTSWPLNSWEVTENSCGYQITYIRLLSKFSDGASYDCSGEKNGTAVTDVCGQCAGGTTGITPIADISQCPSVAVNQEADPEVAIYPNPTNKLVYITTLYPEEYSIQVVNALGQKIIVAERVGSSSLNLEGLSSGTYTIIVQSPSRYIVKKFTKF